MKYTAPPIWRTAPFVRIVGILIAGILLQHHLRLSLTVIICLVIISVAAFLLLHLLFRQTFYGWKWKGLAWLMSGVTLSMLCCAWNDIRVKENWYGHYLDRTQTLLVEVAQYPEPKTNSIYVEAYVLKADSVNVQGKILMYIKDSSAILWRPGYLLLIKNQLQLLQMPSSPGAFDYTRYRNLQQIFHQCFLKQQDYHLLPTKNNRLHYHAYDARSYVLNVLQKYFKDPEVQGIAEALLIGYRVNMDKTLEEAYAKTGVIHVIAISGLHLGLIYSVLKYLLRRVRMLWKIKLLRVVLILSCLWIFSLMTGAPASVLRSAVMFTCVLIGETYFKKSSVYNSLAASAFILLVYNPFFLWDAGFLLSYFAVIGIVSLQRPIEHMIYVPNKWIRQIWAMASVTIAAQIVTLPVCLYYFHQFPTYFLMTNLIVVPLSTILLMAEIGLIFLHPFGCAEPLAGLIEALMNGMNGLIKYMSVMPYATIAPVYATMISSILLMLFIGFVCMWLIAQKVVYRWWAMTMLLGLSIHYCWITMAIYRNNYVVVYPSKGAVNVDIMMQNTAVHLGDLLPNSTLRYYNHPTRIHFRAAKSSSQHPRLLAGSNGFQTGAYRWVHLYDKNQKFDTSFKADFLLISRNYPLLDSSLLSAYQPQMIVLDASNAMWKIEQWKRLSERLNLPCHSVMQDGAFVQKW